MSENEKPSQNSGCSEQPIDFLNRAAEACASGDSTLGLHLYLAAYEKAASSPRTSPGLAVAALREAWRLACDLKERSMAEHVFEKLEPYLTGEEIAECAQALQDLALERLEQYGFSREELEDMAQVITQDLIGSDASVVRVEHISLPGVSPLAPFEASVKFGVSGDSDMAGGYAESVVEQPVAGVPAVDGAELVDGVELVDEAEPVGGASGSGAEASGSDAPAADAPAAAAAPATPAKPAKPMGVASVFNPYDMYPASSEGSSWRAATNIGSGWSESVGLDGTTVLDSRFEGFFPDKKDGEATAESEGEAVSAPEAAAGPRAASGSEKPQAPSDATSAASAQLEGQPQPQPQPQPGQASTASASASAPASASASASTAESSTALAPAAKSAPEARHGEPGVPAMPDIASVGSRPFNYRNLVGYEGAVSMMRDFGVGLFGDAGFVSFVKMMNEQHGLSRMPAADSMLFRAPAIEDATRFVEATIGEIGLPVLRMTMEEGFQGMPVLCVTTDGNNRPRMNRQHNRFEGPAILVLDDLDLWRMPDLPETEEGGMSAFVMANISRAAHETMNFIRASVEDPDVVVLATASMGGEVAPYFYEMLEPVSIIDIGNPTDSERAAIWQEIAVDHPSMRGLPIDDLVRYSAGMARYDIYIAAREAIEETYKAGLVKRTFIPVSPSTIFDKIAACYPLDSDGYRMLEERVLSDFVAGLDEIEDLLDGPRD